MEQEGMPRLKSQEIDYISRVFVNRNLKMESISHMGFDMDHTLAVYKPLSEELAFNMTRQRLIDKYAYPEGISTLNYEPGGVIRGLVVDKKRGNIIKLDTHKYVETAFHGFTRLSKEERKKLYSRPGESYRPSSEDYAYLDTLFCLPEASLYMQLVEYFDKNKGRGKVNYKQIYKEVRESIDAVHRDGTLKAELISHLEKYLVKDPLLPRTLHHFVQGGKRLFLLTNSEYYYTSIVMSFLLDGEISGMERWSDYFDLIVVSARKPLFFLKEAPMEVVDQDESGNEIPMELRNKVYKGGYFKTLENVLKASGESILYFGDHTFGDILKSKQECGWRTAMIIAELESELQTLEGQSKNKESLEMMRRSLQEIRDDVQMLENQIQFSRNRKLDYFEDMNTEEMFEIDRQMEELRGLIAKNEERATRLLKEIKTLDQEISSGYNQRWGCVFKSGRRKSRFGDQVEDFACLYSSKITNFFYYPTTKYFRISEDLMAHERQV